MMVHLPTLCLFLFPLIKSDYEMGSLLNAYIPPKINILGYVRTTIPLKINGSDVGPCYQFFKEAHNGPFVLWA